MDLEIETQLDNKRIIEQQSLFNIRLLKDDILRIKRYLQKIYFLRTVKFFIECFFEKEI